MKKTFIILLAALMLLLAACGSAPAAQQDQQKAAADGQNPVMNFVGLYACGRASILVEPDGAENAKFTVTWGGSYDQSAQWIMSGKFDTENLSVYYQDCVAADITYKENGEVAAEEERYRNGHGFFFFDADSLSLTWQDDQENCAEGLVFRMSLPAEGQDGALLGSGEPDFYSGVTAMEKAAVERNADFIRSAYLNEDWETLSSFIRYPVVVNETELPDAEAFLGFMRDKTVDPDDRTAMSQENCHDMFYNGQGICMGSGQIWLLDPSYMTEEEPQLLVFAISGIVTK